MKSWFGSYNKENTSDTDSSRIVKAVMAVAAIGIAAIAQGYTQNSETFHDETFYYETRDYDAMVKPVYFYHSASDMARYQAAIARDDIAAADRIKSRILKEVELSRQSQVRATGAEHAAELASKKMQSTLPARGR